MSTKPLLAIPAKIMLVDDHEMMRDGLRRLISDQSDLVVVGEAHDSETAWQRAVELQPDLIVMDLDLPGENGVAAIRRIRSAYPQIKVTVITGHLEARYAREALDAGAAGFLLKTGNGPEVLKAIRTVLAGEIYLNAETTAALVRMGRKAGPNLNDPNKPAFSERENEVLRLISEGMRNKEIATKLNIGVKSVETYRARLMRKAGCSSPAELVRYAIRVGLVKA